MAATCLSRSALAGIKGGSGLERVDHLTASAFTPGLLIAPVAKRAPRGSMRVRNVATKPPAKTMRPPKPTRDDPGRFQADGKEMLPQLPQYAGSEQQQRRENFRQENRRDYAVQFEAKPITPLAGAIPILKNLPARETFSVDYIKERVVATSAWLANHKLLELDLPRPKQFKQLFPQPVPVGKDQDEKLPFGINIEGLARLVQRTFETLQWIPDMTSDLSQFKDFKDYKGVFMFDKPKTSRSDNGIDWKSDAFFGHQRLAGANPIALRRAKNANSVPHIAEFRAAFDGKLKIDEEVTAGTLFFIDYETELSVEALPSVRPDNPYTDKESTEKKDKRHFPTPVALFKSDKDKRSIIPLAIYIKGKEGGQVYSAAHSTKLQWEVAKLCVTVADSNLHEMSAHLGRTHFVLQSFNIATCMELPFQHPLRLLLNPHLRFVLHNNALGVTDLINYGGSVEELMGPTLEHSVALAVKSVESWTYQEFVFEKELANRGFEKFNSDDTTLSYYPFRDDGKLIWAAIHNYVSSYIDIYYKTEEDVVEDYELQAWAKQVGSPDLGRITDFPEKIATRKELSDILAVIIWTSSALHSAVNFPQWEYMAYVPTGALALFADYEKLLSDENVLEDVVNHTNFLGDENVFEDSSGVPNVEEQLLKEGLLPGPKETLKQLQMMSLLAAYRYDKLGFEKDPHPSGGHFFFDDLEAKKVQKKFQDALEKAQALIEVRNKERLKEVAPYADYKVLLPSKILNSSSI